jgi:ribosomal protein S24E
MDTVAKFVYYAGIDRTYLLRLSTEKQLSNRIIKRKETNMSHQPEHDHQQTVTPIPEEVRQALLAEVDASKQIIADLSDEELEEIIGAGAQIEGMKAIYKYYREDKKANVFTSLTKAFTRGPSEGQYRRSMGFYDASAMHYALKRDAQLPK